LPKLTSINIPGRPVMTSVAQLQCHKGTMTRAVGGSFYLALINSCYRALCSPRAGRQLLGRLRIKVLLSDLPNTLSRLRAPGAGYAWAR
jgi:hypothetical protein